MQGSATYSRADAALGGNLGEGGYVVFPYFSSTFSPMGLFSTTRLCALPNRNNWIFKGSLHT
jgi:hypothetical protein